MALHARAQSPIGCFTSWLFGPKGQRMTAQGNALGNGMSKSQALKGRRNPHIAIGAIEYGTGKDLDA
ncbi:MAG: hypothetical protein AMXMBFR84_03950 [Candidatus Hydrogenedentota bacterium]